MNDPRVPAAVTSVRSATEHTFSTHDGLALFYRRWAATRLPARGAVLLFHRGHEHSGRNAHLPLELDLPDFDFFAWDARGHGLSPGERGFSPSFGTSIRDVQTFVDHIRDRFSFRVEDMVVLGQSFGAVLAAAWVHDYAPNLRALVLASPAFKVKLYVPFARAGLRVMQKIRGNFFVTSYVKARLLTHDRERIATYDTDPLIARSISVNILLSLYETSERIVSDAEAITVPTQLLISGSDWVVDAGPQHTFFATLGSPIKEKHVLTGFYHDTLGERDRSGALAMIRTFVLARFADDWAPVDLRRADRHGYTRQEADALARALPPWSPQGLYWRVTRAGLRFGGWWSDGVRLGHETGFDSGSTLDYVYRNVAGGRTSLGRLLDRVYLDSVGWRGIRQRKLHVEALVRDAIGRLKAQGRPVHILDIAAGHGRYVLDAIETDAALRPASIVLRDYLERNVHEGRALIRQRKLEHVARFERGDAFDHNSIASLAPSPTLGIVSGLYELFGDNDVVGHSLGGLADAIATGGYLVYTCQPWHPQIELIARALTSHRGGKPWVMRRRTQAEMDQLVSAAGFRKVSQRIDESGIFTVSLAIRIPD